MSHGISSILSILCKSYMNNYNIKNTDILIRYTVNFLLKSKQSNMNSLYPNYIDIYNYKGVKTKKESRLAWCYGDLGVGIALWHASQALGQENWKQESINIFVHAAKRRELEQNGIVDAGLCHGTAGIAHIFNRMFRNTGIKEFKDSSDYWILETIKMAKFKDGLAGYKAWHGKNGWQNEYGFLEGIAGIGLALIAAISDDDPTWDECLLLS